MKKGFITSDLFTSTALNRNEIYNFYLNKYYNLYMNAYKWNGLTDEQKDFVMRKFWSDGKVACFKMKGTEGSTEYPNGLLVFTPYAPTLYNIYDYPTEVTLINKRGVKFIPATPQIVDKDVVLGYTQRNKKGVFMLVDFYLKKIADVEMTIKTNLKAQKTPWIVGVTPESENKMTQLWDNLEKDEPRLFISIEEVNNAKALVSGANYNIDKLYAYKCALENELKEYLGISNLGNQEKKEHLITSEVQANDEVTSASSNCFLNVLEEFCKRIQEVLGITISVELNQEKVEYDEREESDYVMD